MSEIVQHPDDTAVDAFAAAMKEKLAAARAKGHAGWEDKTDCLQQRLSDMLRAHVEKGDPRDVANLCMFLYQRGEAILASSAPFVSMDEARQREQLARARLSELEVERVSGTNRRASMQFTLGQAETLLAFFGRSNGDMTVEYFPANHCPDSPDAPAGLYVYCTEYPDEGAQWLGEEDNSEDIKPTWSSDSEVNPPALAAQGEANRTVADDVRDFGNGFSVDGKRIDPARVVIYPARQPRAVPETWLPMDTAPRDGTMLRLLVQFEEHATEDTTEPAPTIGAYCETAECWQFAGWCWSHDHFTEGKGSPTGWLPLLGAGVTDGMVVVPERFVANVRAAARIETHPRAVPQLIAEAMNLLAATPSPGVSANG